MIHLKYKCKVNFVKLPLIWIDLCLKLDFEIASAGRNRGCRLVVNCASCSLQLPQTISHQAEYITHQLVPKTQFTGRRVRELKNAHNSVTVQNRRHVYMNFFDQKDQGNHLLQGCPQVVKHPVCSVELENLRDETAVIYLLYSNFTAATFTKPSFMPFNSSFSLFRFLQHLFFVICR